MMCNEARIAASLSEKTLCSLGFDRLMDNVGMLHNFTKPKNIDQETFSRFDALR